MSIEDIFVVIFFDSYCINLYIFSHIYHFLYCCFSIQFFVIFSSLNAITPAALDTALAPRQVDLDAQRDPMRAKANCPQAAIDVE